MIWLLIGTAVIGGLAVPLLFYFRKPMSATMAFIVALVALLLTPILARDKIVLDDSQVMQGQKGFQLADIDYIVVGFGPAGKKMSGEVWYVYYHDRESVNLKLNDLWKLHKRDILKRLKAKGIDIRYHSGSATTLPIGELDMSPTPVKP
jgi:hypothetical protein